MTKLSTFAACLLALCLPLAAAAATRTLRVVGDNNYPPYLFIGPDGKPQGYAVDAWKLWESKTGIKVELTATNWADAQQRLRSGQADVIDMIFRTPERAATLDFTRPFATVTTGIYADRNLTGIADASGLRGFVVGVQRGDACVERLHRAGVSSLREYTGYSAIIDAARRGDIRIFCMDRSPAEYYLYRLHAQEDFVKAFDFYSDRFRRGVRKGDAAKAALHALSDSLRVELKSFGINVMTVAPGGTKSNLGSSSAAKYDQMHEWKYYKKYEEGLRARTDISQGPGATPAEELAKKVVASVLKKNPPAWFAYGQFSAILSMLYYAPLWFRDYFYKLVMKC